MSRDWEGKRGAASPGGEGFFSGMVSAESPSSLRDLCRLEEPPPAPLLQLGGKGGKTKGSQDPAAVDYIYKIYIYIIYKIINIIFICGYIFI